MSLRIPTVLVGLVLLGSSLSAQGALRIHVPLYSAKAGKALEDTSFKHLNAGSPIRVLVELQKGPAGAVIHSETLQVAVRSPETQTDLALGRISEPGKIQRTGFDVVLGGDATNPLPSSLGDEDIWYTTQVSLLDKSGTVAKQIYARTPPQPLGVAGYTHGLDIAPASIRVDGQNGFITLDASGLRIASTTGLVPEDYVLTSDAFGRAKWAPLPAGVGISGQSGFLPYYVTETALGESSLRETDSAIQVDKPLVAEGGLIVPDNAAAGRVLVSDGSGSAGWQDLVVDSMSLVDGSIGSDQLADGAVTAPKIADGSITNLALADGSVTGADLQDGSITGDKLAPGSITADVLGDAVVFENTIAPESITSEKIVANAVTADKIKDGSITDIKLAPDSVTAVHIAAGAVGANQLADGAVTTAKIKDFAVTIDKFATDAVDSRVLKNGGVERQDIAAGAVDSQRIKDGSVDTEDLANNAVTSPRILDGTIRSVDIEDGAVDSSKLAGFIGADVSTDSGQVTHRGANGAEDDPLEWFEINPENGFNTSGNDAMAIEVGAAAPGTMQFLEMTVAGAPEDVRFRVDVSGSAYADGSFNGGGADYADMIRVSTGGRTVEPGDVLAIDPVDPRSVRRSSEPRSRLVAGIYSTQPGVVGSERSWDAPAADGGEAVTYRREDFAHLFDEVPLALMGIVPCKVSAENGPVRPGDLLVTSSTPGHAMRDDRPEPGTILGKALGSIDYGTGLIDVLVMLQ